LLSRAVAVAEEVPGAGADDLFPEERAQAASFADKRRQHFAAGRRTARRAMAELGVQPQPVPIGAAREPGWPSGVVGSISHTDDYCAAAVARAGEIVSLGIDVELAASVGQRVAERIAVEAEWKGTGARDESWATVLFSAKEAFYKLQSPVTGEFLGFRDVLVEIAPRGDFELELLRDVGDWKRGRRFSGRYHLGDRHVLTAMVFKLP